MTDSDSIPNATNPYTPETDPKKVDAAASLRMWPAVLIIGLMWFLIVVPGKIFPLTMIHFLSMQIGPVVCSIALAIWWLASRGVPWRARWTGIIAVFATAMGVLFLSHKTMAITMLVYGLPTALTILVVTLLILAPQKFARRRLYAYGGYALFLLMTLLFRVGAMDASFAFSLAPRWTPNAEARFLEELQSSEAGGSEVSASVEVPDSVSVGDWAEFRGPDRDGVLPNVRFETDWQASPPTELWRRSVGPAWSSFCVVGAAAYTQEQRGEEETVVAYRVQDGTPIWTTTISARFEASMGGVGPRATPTFDRGLLYVMGATGTLQCLDAATGEPIWSYDLVSELEIGTPDWGFASSPLIIDDLVVVFAGGGPGQAVLALDRDSGNRQWLSGNGSHSYVSPQLSTIDGTQQIVVSSNLGLCSLSVDGGEVLWEHEWDIAQFARVTQPLVVGNAVYLGTGYGNGTERVTVRRDASGTWQASADWVAPLKPYFNDFVHHKGHLYGFDDSIFTSIDAESGERNWKRGRYGFGQVLLLPEMELLLVISEDGEVVLLRADPSKHTQVASFQAIEGVTWNHPVIADGKLFVRNASEAACFALPDFQRIAPPVSIDSASEAVDDVGNESN